jgi:hypothetical protein
MKILSGLAVSIIFVFACAPLTAAETITYKYDARGRLIKVVRSGTVNNNVQVTYEHDKANNRKKVVVTGSPNGA